MESGILVLDEPTAGLDGSSRKALMEILRQLNSESKTIILISHDAELLDSLCIEKVSF